MAIADKSMGSAVAMVLRAKGTEPATAKRIEWKDGHNLGILIVVASMKPSMLATRA